MDILSYLTDLLKTKKEVGIEGLGTFVKVKVPGRYDMESHSFIPPKHTLSFKDEVSETSNLIIYLSERGNIAAESAKHYIGLFKEDIRRQLAVSNEADLDSLGILTYRENSLILKEQGSPDLGSDYYGLPKLSTTEKETSSSDAETSSLVDLPATSTVNDNQDVYDEITELSPITTSEPQIEIETPETLIQEEIDQEQVVSKVSDEVQEPKPSPTPQGFVEQSASKETASEPVDVKARPNTNSASSDNGTANIWHFDRERSTSSTSEKSNDTSEDTGRGIPAWIKGLALAVILLVTLGAVAYFIRPEWFNESPVTAVQTTTKKPAIPPVAPIKIDTAAVIDSSKMAIPLTAKDTAGVISSVVPPPSTSSPAITWEIIGASLTKKEVNWYIKDMKSRGYIAKPMPALPGKRTKMSIATFNDEESAKEGRKLLIQKLKNKDLYIFQNKHIQKPK
ncbi:MAG: hypothetical protein WKF66_09515 [Pedobacter sp.]